MIDWTQKKLEEIGTTVEQIDIGSQTLPDGRKLKLPNVIMGVLGNVSREEKVNFDLKRKTAKTNTIAAAYLIAGMARTTCLDKCC